MDAPSTVWSAIESLGRPLEAAERISTLPLDVAAVRVHIGPAAAESARALRASAYSVGDDVVLGEGYDPASPAGRRLIAHELVHVAEHQRQIAPPAVHREGEQGDDEPAPTYGNLPRDEPDPNARRVQLRKIEGKWQEVLPGGEKKPAIGRYEFVVVDDEIWAVKGRGHTEAARGGRVQWAGTLRIRDGKVIEWTDASGHYRSASSLRKGLAERVGLPEDKFKPDPEAHEPPRRVQLPVQQPKTRPRTSGPTKVPPGSPRTGEYEQRYGRKPPAGTAGDAGGAASPTADKPAAAPTAAPSTAPAAPSTTASKRAAPVQGVIAEETVTIEYDVTDPETPVVKMKNIDVSQFPPDNEGPVTRFFRDRPVMRQLVNAGATAVAGIVAGKALDAVHEHFAGAVGKATAELEKRFPPSETLRDDLEDQEETYRSVMQWMKDFGKASGTGAPVDDREKEENLKFAFDYESTLLNLREPLPRDVEQLDSIHKDLRRRADVLTHIGLDIEKSFIWIHEHAVGSLLPVYYESMALWQVRGVFLDLGARLGSLAAAVQQRKTAYVAFIESFDQELTKMALELDIPWGEFYQRNKALLH